MTRTTARNRATVSTADFADYADVECELIDEPGTHTIEHVEMVTMLHYDIDPSDSSPNNLDIEHDLLWINCSCGHQTRTY
jgi:hypothetical protein